MTSTHRLSAWVDRWRSVLPILAAELIVWMGFGALLPILPIFFRERGLDFATLGIVIAAWPAARLVGEPIFGWLADRSDRRILMVAGLVGAGICLGLPLIAEGAGAFLVLRALTGLSTAAYDPAARGFLSDSADEDRRGEVFGLYGAAQMGGLMLGPAIGGVGAQLFGGYAFPFVFGAVSSIAAAVVIGATLRQANLRGPAGRHLHPTGLGELHPDPPSVLAAAARDAGDDDDRSTGAPRRDRGTARQTSLWNRAFVAATIINAGGFFAAGAYEVVWSLFLDSRGAGTDLIGLTFALFGLPVLILSPLVGRIVDRRGSRAFIIVGTVTVAGSAIVYPALPDVLLTIPMTFVEASGFSLLSPALFAVVARSSPAGRSSTAQGIFGAAGTFGFIVSSVAAGVLAATDVAWPFYLIAIVMLATLAIGLAIGFREIGRVPASVTADALATDPRAETA